MADSPSSTSQPPVPPPSQPPASSRVGSQSHELPPPSSTPTIPAAGSSASAEPAVVPKREPDTTDGAVVDVAIEQDIEMANTGGANEGDNTVAPEGSAPDAIPTSIDAIAPAVAPSKKETSLREFLGKMDEYAPIIPDAVTAHYLTLAGLPPPGTGPNQTPPHLARLLALATQKFIADIAADSYQYARIRASNSSSANNPMGSLNAASGLNVPAGAAGAGAAGGAGGLSSSDASKNKANTHLGIQRPGFGGGGSGGSGQGRTVLTMEDLGMAVSEYGVSVKRGEFYR